MRFGFLVLAGLLALAGLARAQGTAPTFITYPAAATVYVGDAAAFSAAVDGPAPINYRWFKEGVAIAGATNASLAFSSVALTDAGLYRLDATNAAGTTSASTYLYVNKRPQTITFNAPTTSATGTGVTLAATASSGLPVTFTLVSGAAALNGSQLVATSGSVVVRAAQAGNGAYLAADPVDRAISFLTGAISPFITSPPLDQTAAAGASVTFRATAIGTPIPTYQWSKDGAALDGATSNALTLGNVALADTGRYTVTVTNIAGSATATAALTVQVAPAITQQPADVTVAAGSAASFTVAATAVPAARFQWRRNGTAISGATRETFTLNSAATGDAGRYDVVISNPLGSVTSAAATLTVNVRVFTGTYFGRIDEAAPTGAGEFALLVRANRTAVFLARAAGNTAAVVTSVTVDLSGNFTATTDALGTAALPAVIRGAIDEVAGTVAGTLTLGAARASAFAGTRAGTVDTSGSRAGFYAGAIPGSAATRGWAIVAPDGDTLLVVAAPAGVDSARGPLSGAGRLAATGAAGTAVDVSFAAGTMRGTLGAGANAAPLLGALDSLLGAERLVNVSVRTSTSTAAPLITGFVISGGAAKQVLIRGAGPALAQAPFNVAGALADPTLLVQRGNTPVAQNDDWGQPAANTAAISAATTRTGAFPFRAGSNDAAISTTLAPAAYTVQVGGGNGVVLAEIYEDLATGEAAGTRRLINLSARGLVAPGAPLIAGFVIGGTAPLRVLVRGVGPTLGGAPFNVPGVLANPQLTVFRGSTALKSNDDWFRDADATLIRDTAARVGAFALSQQRPDASVLLYLEPGAYTVQVSGPTGASGAAGVGTALVELYEAP